MNAEEIGELIKTAQEIAPRIEEALKSVEDEVLRQVIAKAIIGRILREVGSSMSAAEKRHGRISRSQIDGNEEKNAVGGTQGRILELKAEGFFAKPRNIEEVQAELRLKGFHHNKPDVRMSLLRLAKRKSLRRLQKVNNGRATFSYVDP